MIIRNFTSLEMQHKNDGFEDLEDVNGWLDVVQNQNTKKTSFTAYSIYQGKRHFKIETAKICQ